MNKMKMIIKMKMIVVMIAIFENGCSKLLILSFNSETV